MKVNKKLILIVGFRKCGTTTLFDYLSQHEGISAASPKEPQLLCSGNRLDEEFLAGYLSCFDQNAEILLDGSTLLISDPDAIQWAIRTFSEVKIVVCIRNPVNRFISSYWHSKGKENPQEYRGLDEVIEQLDSWGKDKFFKEKEWLNEQPFHRQFYSGDYLRSNKISLLDFNPKERFLPFRYFGEGVYSHWVEQLNIGQYHVVLLEELMQEKDSIERLSQYIEFPLNAENFSSFGASNKGANRSTVAKLNFLRFGGVYRIFPASFRKWFKGRFHKSIPPAKKNHMKSLELWYEGERKYWKRAGHNIQKYWW
ncbi:sulfotransferase domain-containing protein [Microbulbifer pacificus]|uniref:Sulfotransferase domain-containing protein n=1 Tax=Microbulbifer pacificus TaxID=407164 RepID=A0AAU0MYJ6_9GAMM|nr:sulfotransferase domain-containing protein [Microbulbifer pacificus]WOX04836.1 sulfotransferase domain-containing protein [Microbulbifer pacificus]